LASPDDPAQVAAAVTAMMKDPALRARLGQAARDLSRQFRWEAIAQRHLEVYGELD
jgi:glycosyltransferase involved in cell wall biosynthesis